MESASEIRSAVNNIRYYSKQINELSNKQFNRDCEIGQLIGISTEPGSVRFTCLGCICSAANWIETYCKNIEANVKYAEEQDKKLRPEPEEIETEETEAITPEEFR